VLCCLCAQSYIQGLVEVTRLAAGDRVLIAEWCGQQDIPQSCDEHGLSHIPAA
jgi:hypothetical protein